MKNMSPSVGIMIPNNIWKNKKCSKPPTSMYIHIDCSKKTKYSYLDTLKRLDIIFDLFPLGTFYYFGACVFLARDICWEAKA
jgi:hypothetical protein